MNVQATNTPLISICIPAYKNTAYLKRLLDSIAGQTFKDYEVIVTDDSPDNSVKDFIDSYTAVMPLYYCKNRPAAGTPENWNVGIRQARGTWIKLMHDDDWFAESTALQTFFQATQMHPHCAFFFAAFQNITEGTGAKEIVRCNAFDRFFLRMSPLHLFKRVYVGNPSCTFIRRDIGLLYDKEFKFVVDFEYYIRCFRKLKHWHYIDNVLLNIGFNEEQVTKYTFLNPAVQLLENYKMLEKFGFRILRNLFVYDYYWRMHRNLGIDSIGEAEGFYKGIVPVPMQSIIEFQSKLPKALLKTGIFSKVLMSVHYIGFCLKSVLVR